MALPARLVRGVRDICSRLPEAEETTTFGNPTWKVGKKTFAVVEEYRDGPVLSFKAHAEERLALLEDDRFSVARYTGRYGWLVLQTRPGVDWDEVEELVTTSYQLAAPKRLLRALDASG